MANNNNLSSRVKLAWLKGMEAIGTSASNLASNAKQKVTEMNLETRRREILTDVSLKAFEMWQKGETLPEPLSGMLQELSEVDERLSVLRAQKYDAALEAQHEPSQEEPDEASEAASESTEEAVTDETVEEEKEEAGDTEALEAESTVNEDAEKTSEDSENTVEDESSSAETPEQ